MKIKKILIIPVVIISVLISCISLSASATTLDDITKYYVPLSDCLEEYPAYSEHFFYCQIRLPREVSGHPDWTSEDFYTFFITFKDNPTYSDDNGNMVFTSASLSNCYYDRWYYEKLPDRDSIGGLSVGDAYRILHRDSSISSLNISEDCTTMSIVCNSYTFTDIHVQYMEYNIEGLTGKYNAINVSFKPDLVGQVDRSVNLQSGNTALTNDLIFNIQNVGNQAVQYQMYIVAKNQDNLRGNSSNAFVYFDDDPVFKYYSFEWVYADLEKWKFTQKKDWFDNFVDLVTPWSNDNDEDPESYPVKSNKATDWHYLGANSSSSQTIHFSQINLREGVEYTVVVKAIYCPYDYATIIDSSSPKASLCQLDLSNAEVVYSSDFSMLQYDDVIYDPNDDSNGVIPYNGYDGNEQSLLYDMSYDAVENPDGSIDYKGFQYKDFDLNGNSGLDGNSIGGNSDANYNSLLSQTSSVFTFYSDVLSFFPKEIFILLNLGLWTLIFILLIKKV